MFPVSMLPFWEEKNSLAAETMESRTLRHNTHGNLPD